MRYTLNNFSCKYDYPRYQIIRRLSVLSDFTFATSFNLLFRQEAAVSLLGHCLACITGIGILTDSSSGSPLGYPLDPD